MLLVLDFENESDKQNNLQNVEDWLKDYTKDSTAIEPIDSDTFYDTCICKDNAKKVITEAEGFEDQQDA